MIERMDTNNFLRKISLPKRYFDNNFVIIDKLKYEKAKFLELLKLCSATEFDEEQQRIVVETLHMLEDEISQTFLLIENIFTNYENSDMMQAQIFFDELMHNLKDDIFISDISGEIGIDLEGAYCLTNIRITKGYDFYRVRSVDSESTVINENANQLFHLPLSKREYANGGRFSLTGFPSLYLSSMLPLAWQETGYPQKYYYSEYCYKQMFDSEKGEFFPINNLKFVSLYSPSEIAFWSSSTRYNNFKLWKQVFTRYLKIYPLVLACSFVNQRGNSPYKQEYIIPQMLMQWVQRNSEHVQGISYFTCLDMSYTTGGWCAYNLALPATKPHNEDGYSQLLNESFNWSVPEFYSIPISDLSQNKSDRKTISEFIDEASSMLMEQYIPRRYADAMVKIVSISTQFLSLLTKSNGVDMELVLNMLKSIRTNREIFRKENIESYVEGAKADIELGKDYCGDRFDELTERFSILYKRFISTQDKDSDIGGIVEKHEHYIWNYLRTNPCFEVLVTNKSQVGEIIDYMQNNNMLWRCYLLKNNKESLDKLMEINKYTGQQLESFWDTPIGDEQWLLDNIINIKQPIIIKRNSVSILSPKEIKEMEFISFGFDKNVINTSR